MATKLEPVPANTVPAPLISFHPPITELSPGSFVQEIRMNLGDDAIATLRWHAGVESQGVVQILDVFVETAHQRKGYGTLLYRTMLDQLKAFYGLQNQRPRRIWVAIQQIQQLTARAFFSRHGFHHITTIKMLFIEQESMVYLRSCD